MKQVQNVALAQPLSPGFRRFLYLTAGVTGAVIMIVEILGAKMLSPYLGTSHFVWTAQIAVTLVALAVGYYAGGTWADKTLQPGKLYGAILAAGAYLALTVLVTEPIAYGCLRYSLPVGSLLSSLVLYFVPLSLMAMTGPFLIRVLTVSVSGVGSNVGRLTAISTLGSFVGTMLIGYLIIPHLPNSVTMLLAAVVLMMLAVAYFLAFGKSVASKLTAIAVWATSSLAGHQGAGDFFDSGDYAEELYRGNSNFGILQVIQFKDSPRRMYLNDYLTQNTYDTNEQQSVSMFTYMLHGLARAYTTNIQDVLCIGLGVGIVPMKFARENARVDVVEINPAVVAVGRDFFDLQPEQMNIIIGDGRSYLNQSAKRYDAVVLDAFLGDSCPSHLMTREAFAAMRRNLNPGGTLVINTFGSFDSGKDFFTASLWKTLTNVFTSVRIHSGYHGNTLFVASDRERLDFVNAPDFNRVHPSCVEQVKDAFASLRETNPRHGIVLRDDYNPVEYYDARNREEHRKILAASMKSM